MRLIKKNNQQNIEKFNKSNEIEHKEIYLKNWDADIAASIYSNCIDVYKNELTKIANSILKTNLDNKTKIAKWNKESEQWHLNYSKKYFKENYDDLKTQMKDMLEYAIENKINYDVVIGSYSEELSDSSLDDRIDNNVSYETDLCFDEVCDEIDFEWLVENDSFPTV